MAYLHPAVVHRDLKPSNVLLDAAGRAQVCDFGLAKLRRGTLLATAAATASTAGLAGTPAYLAPEIFEGRAATEKSDVFSFAVLLWECVTGRQPWEQLNPMQIMYAVGVQGSRLPLPDTEAGCPPELAVLVGQCWDESPAARPAFREVLARLQAMQQALAVRQQGQLGLQPAAGGGA
jgi:serine/threonine protein kinase